MSDPDFSFSDYLDYFIFFQFHISIVLGNYDKAWFLNKNTPRLSGVFLREGYSITDIAPMTKEYKHNMILRVSQVFVLFVILLV